MPHGLFLSWPTYDLTYDTTKNKNRPLLGGLSVVTGWVLDSILHDRPSVENLAAGIYGFSRYTATHKQHVKLVASSKKSHAKITMTG